VVAVRRWDSPEPLSAGERCPLTLFLYSLGGPIDRVELLVEAQAEIEPPGRRLTIEQPVEGGYATHTHFSITLGDAHLYHGHHQCHPRQLLR
jgi:hypothetical protein